MKSSETDSFLSFIEETVFDEKKIVTYGWLAKSLGIHPNLAKQLLHTFCDNSEKKSELSVTYLVIGRSKNEENDQILLIKDKSFQEAESSLGFITSKHIYSIQKCIEINDLNDLYISQKEENNDVSSKGISAVEFNCNERDGTIIAKLKSKALPTAATKVIAAVKKNSTQPPAKTKSPKKSPIKEKSQAPEEVKSELKPESKKTIHSMFKNNTGSKNKQALKPTKAKQPTGIGAFFNKAKNKDSSESIKKEESKPTEVKNELKTEVHEGLSSVKENKATLNMCAENKNDLKSTDDIKKQTPVKSSKAENKSKPSTKKNTGKVDKKSKKASAKKVSKEQKNRKRLVVLSDSDSNNESENEEEMEREPTPEPEPTVIPDEDADDIVNGTPEPCKKRKRKLVSRTFTSPDGYMVTEKEYVNESCSDNDDEPPVNKKLKESPTKDDKPTKESSTSITNDTKSSQKKNTNSSTKEKTSSPPKTKQASLMSFFKKK